MAKTEEPKLDRLRDTWMSDWPDAFGHLEPFCEASRARYGV